jgi:hypothetical protein
MLAGLLLGAPLAAATSYGFAIVTTSALCAAALLVAFLMKEPARAAEQASEPYLRTLVAGTREAWRTPSLRWIFFFSGTIGACAAGPQLLLQQPWLAAHGIGTARLGVWQGFVQAAEILAALAAGRLLTSLGERGAFLALPLILSLCCAALAGIDGLWIAAAFFGVALARGFHHPVLAGYVNRRIASERRATLLSVQSVAGNLLMAVAWPLAGVAADRFGLRGPFLMFAFGALALGGSALLLWNRAERESLGRTLEPGRSP